MARGSTKQRYCCGAWPTERAPGWHSLSNLLGACSLLAPLKLSLTGLTPLLIAMDHGQEMLDPSSGKGFASLAPQALHQHLASTFEAALARSLPKMEVRFDNISVSADVNVLNEDVFELPTIPNVLKKSFIPARTTVVKKQILKNVSGVFRPGTMTLVLGQPGSGKSSLMRLLSGRFPITKNVTVEGKMTYNGVEWHALTQKLPQFVSYVPQSDNHFPTLTVKETLEFAHAFTGGELLHRGEDLLPLRRIRWRSKQPRSCSATTLA